MKPVDTTDKKNLSKFPKHGIIQQRNLRNKQNTTKVSIDQPRLRLMCSTLTLFRLYCVATITITIITTVVSCFRFLGLIFFFGFNLSNCRRFQLFMLLSWWHNSKPNSKPAHFSISPPNNVFIAQKTKQLCTFG